MSLDVNDIVGRALRIAKTSLEDLSRRRGVTIEVRFDPAGQPVLIQGSLVLIGALVHAIESAVEAMPDGGEIRIRTSRENGHAVISVEDTGRPTTSGPRPGSARPVLREAPERGSVSGAIDRSPVRGPGDAAAARSVGERPGAVPPDSVFRGVGGSLRCTANRASSGAGSRCWSTPASRSPRSWPRTGCGAWWPALSLRLLPHLALLPVIVPMWAFLLVFFRAYRSPGEASILELSLATIRAVGAGLVLLLALVFLLRAHEVSRAIVISFGILDCVVLVAARAGAGVGLPPGPGARREAPARPDRGDGEPGRAPGRPAAARRPEWGIDIVGFLDTDPTVVGKSILGSPGARDARRDHLDSAGPRRRRGGAGHSRAA